MPQKRKYYKDNRETKLAYQNKYNRENKEQIDEYRHKRDKSEHRKVYMREYMRNYYAKNKGGN